MTSEQVETFPWMNEDYFKSILTKYEGHDDIKLRNLNLTAGTNKGENFASAIYRVSLSYLLIDEEKEVTFILKTSSSSGAISEMLEEMGTFPAETHIYTSILPEMAKLIPDFKIAPRLVHADKNALVLEDLNRLDFKLANRKHRFDLPRAKVALAKLAQYHAATAVIYAKNPKLMDNHLDSIINCEEMTPLSFFFTVSMQETVETVRTSPELKGFLSALEEIDIVEREKKVFTRCADDKFHVLNHGDLWINNFFFALNDHGEPVDAMLVDYQECYWGSPGLDLNHFLYTSCNFDVHMNHVNELIQFYHEHLTKTLKQLHFENIPTLSDIQEELARKADQALVVLCSVVPVMMIENSENAHPENFIADGEGASIIRREVYGNPKFVEVLKFMLPILVEKKVI